MALLVQKYGGSSVGTVERIEQVADKIIQAKQNGHQIVVVVSAMYGETDRLIRLAHTLTPHPDPREYDALLATGEQVSTALLGIALNKKNHPARSLTGWQVGIHTNNQYTDAAILSIDTTSIHQALANDQIVIVTGFQGINEKNDITTLGRGGSDATAVALAHAIQATECQIYTDVNGVYTTDPYLIPEARLLPQISFDEMLIMANLGAKVMQKRAVELAKHYGVSVRVLSTFSDHPGTLITHSAHTLPSRAIVGIAFHRDAALMMLSPILLHQANRLETHIVHALKTADIEVDRMVYHPTTPTEGELILTVAKQDYAKTLSVLESIASIEKLALKMNTKVAKLSLVGLALSAVEDMISHIKQQLEKAQIETKMIAATSSTISITVDEGHLEKSVRTMHQTFALDEA